MTRTISFIIPAFQEEKFIGNCISSIRKAMLRSSMHYEIIVVDDHSTDSTNYKAFIHGAKVIFTIGKGIVKARQTGFEVSEGSLIAFIDADNRLPKSWLTEALKYFDDEEVVAVTGPLRFYDMPRWFCMTSRMFYWLASLSHKHLPMMQGGNYVIRRWALEVAGGFDSSIEFWAEDTRTAIQLSEIGKIIYNPQMYIYSSGRRFSQGGIISTTYLYIINYFYMSFFGKPATSKHRNYR